MKHFIKVVTLTTVLIGFLSAEIAFKALDRERAQILSSDSAGTSIRLTSGSIDRDRIQMSDDSKKFSYSLIDGSKDAQSPGAPDIPIIEKLVRVPNLGKVSIQIISQKSTPFESYEVGAYQLPLSHAGTRAPYAYNQELFSQEQFPQECVQLIAVERLGDIRIARIHYYPLRYYPEAKRSDLISEVIFTVKVSSQRGENEIPKAKKLQKKLRPFYKKVLNMGTPQVRAQDAVPTYLIIGNSETIAQVDELIKWKTQKGLTVMVKDVSEIGTTTSQIDSYIEQVHSECEGLLFVLLCGDENIIPSFQMSCPYSKVKSPSDNAYGVIGSGYNPSIYVGRITNGREDMSAYAYQAWKIVEHESNPEEGAWMTKAMTWGCSQPNGDPTASHWQNQLQDAGMTCSKELESQGAKKAAQLVNSFNAGLTTFSMKGHGNDQSWASAKIGLGYGNAAVETMEIGGRFCWVNNIACLNSRFQYSSYTCFAEQMMAIGSIGDAKGCLGMYSFTVSSSGGSPTTASDGMLSALYEGLFEDDMRHVGLAAAYGTMSSGTSGDKESSMIWGCPETDIYFQYPLNTFTEPTSAPVPGKPFTIETGVAGALVSLVTKSYEPLAAGYTDALGDITLNLPDYEAATILTMTARNCKPLIKEYKKTSTISHSPNLHKGAIYNCTLKQNEKTALLQFVSSKEQDVTLHLVDQRGRTLMKKSVRTVQGKNLISQDLTLSSGMYLLLINHGNQTLTQKVQLY